MLDWSTRVIWLDQGRIMADGDPREVLDRYRGTAPPEANPEIGLVDQSTSA